MQNRRGQAVSQLAIRLRSPERRRLVPRGVERQDRVQPAVTAPQSTVPSAAAKRGSSRIPFLLIAVLSLAGIVVSAVSLQRHYAKSATAYCDFSQQFNCDIVNRSEYSTVLGIPVAAIGVAGYGALFLLATFWKSREAQPN